MNRFTLLISTVAGAAIVLTAACGGAAPAPTATSAPAPATTAPVATTAPPSGNGGGDAASIGLTLVQSNGCAACHSIDGSTILGPSWQGIYGREEHLTDGSSVIVDDAYIRESIVDPNAKIVEGFQPNLMPATFGTTLSDADIDAIIAYMKGL